MNKWMLSVGCLLALACGAPEPRECADPPLATYEANVKPMLEANCTACHSASSTGPARRGAPDDVNLDTYANAKAVAERAATEVEAGRMPPGGGELTEEEACVLRGWIKGGLLE